MSIDVSGNGATSNTTLLLTNVTMTGNVAMGIEGGVQGPRVPLACALGGPRVVLCIFLVGVPFRVSTLQGTTVGEVGCSLTSAVTTRAPSPAQLSASLMSLRLTMWPAVRTTHGREEVLI